MVAEADESDRSFLKLFPTIAVITNIDHEHLENYGGFEDLQQAFVDFANKVPFYGAVVACADDGPLAAVLPRLTRRVTTYGLDAHRPPKLHGGRRQVFGRDSSTQATVTSAPSSGNELQKASEALGTRCGSCAGAPPPQPARTHWPPWPLRHASSD